MTASAEVTPAAEMTASAEMTAAAEAIVSPFEKGLGWLGAPVPQQQAAALGWNLLREEISLPAAVLLEERLRHNAGWMQRFIREYGMQLAPHGKTTMAPKLFHLQLEHGAWGITLATAQQVRVAYAHGVRRVLLANQLVGRGNMHLISELLRDPAFEFWCLVDAPAQVEQLAAFFRPRGQQVRVLLEAGVAGGRGGVRKQAQCASVLTALGEADDTVQLCGVELFEGVCKEKAEVQAFLGWAIALMRGLLAEGRLRTRPALLTGAGSAWYDVVADAFQAAGFGNEVQVVLRPGCYLTHDAGAYSAAQARILDQNAVAQRMHSGLRPALQVWAYVHSVPEPTLAIVGLGKRDAAFDAGLPVPAVHYRPGDTAPVPPPAHWAVTKMMDQHAFLAIEPEDDVQPGDMIGFDVCHPCLTFDKWRTLLVVDDAYRVTDLVQTFF